MSQTILPTDSFLFKSRSVRNKDIVDFHCTRCNQCCRHIANSVLVEPIDAFYITKHLIRQGEALQDTIEFYNQYCVPMPVEGVSFPMFLLNTTGDDDACIFLKGNCCSIYEVRPRTCRLYPFAVDYGRNGRSFEYLLCTEKPHHLCGGRTSVNQWMQENLSREYKEFLIHSHTFLQEAGGLLLHMSREKQESLLSMFLFLYDTGYDFDQPFLPQHKSRTTRILDILKRESK